MARAMPFRIGADASCSDGACGHLSRIIVDPVAREVTHLVVDQKRNGPGRLVPVELVDATTGQIRFRCTLAEFQALLPAQETEVVPDLDPTGHQDSARSVNFLPVSLGPLWLSGERGPGRPKAPEEVTVDSVPFGAVDIRPELIVGATDGEIGQVQGVVVEPGGRYVTHVLLRGGRMWGRKEVAVPIGAVVKFGTLLIHLSLTKHQVKDLPSVDIDDPAG
jgi:PRC-barrel domain